MYCLRKAGFSKTCLQRMYGKTLFGKTHNGKGKVSVLWKRACVHERKMHGMPGKACFNKHRQGSDSLFLQTVEP